MFSQSIAPDAVLKPLERWHAAELAGFMERARDHLRPWIPFSTRIVDEATALVFLQDWAERQFLDTGRLLGIWVDGVLSGGTLIRFTPFNVCEVGVWLDPAVEGRGLINAAVRHLLDWAFGERGMARAEWFCATANTRSAAAAQRLGMRHEGTMRGNFVVEGRRQDSEVYAILADEWRA